MLGEQGAQDPEMEGLITAHENDHSWGLIPEEQLSREAIYQQAGFMPSSSMWYKKGGAETLTRLGQIANWFGIKDVTKQPLTGSMLKYAANKGRYLKDAGFDNHVTEFFELLKNFDAWEKAAQFYNRYGKAVLPVIGSVGIGSAVAGNVSKYK